MNLHILKQSSKTDRAVIYLTEKKQLQGAVIFLTEKK